MSLTLPSHLESLASVTGATEIFTFDETALAAAGRAIASFCSQASPALAASEAAADRYVAAIGGASSDAFVGHWNTLASSGHAGTLMNASASLATVLEVAAHAVTVVKVAVMGYLTWCAARLAAAALTGVGGVVISAHVILQTRTMNGTVIRRLFAHLMDILIPVLRRQLHTLYDMLSRVNLPQIGSRPAFDIPLGGHTDRLWGPMPKGSERMDMAANDRPWLSNRRNERLPWLEGLDEHGRDTRGLKVIAEAREAQEKAFNARQAADEGKKNPE